MGKKEQFSVEELEELFKLVDLCIDGPEHGVMTSTQWREKCKNLYSVVVNRGYSFH